MQNPPTSLSPWQAGALVVGSMVGTGVFTTSGFLLEQVGARWAVLVVWALAGGLALAGAAVYGELGAMMPRVGTCPGCPRRWGSWAGGCP